MSFDVPMKFQLLFAIQMMGAFYSFSQKHLLDTGDLKEWGTVEAGSISNNGNHVIYTGRSAENLLTTFVVNLSTGQQHVFHGEDVRRANFSSNSQFLVYKQGDTVHQLNLLTGKNYEVEGVKTYESCDIGIKEFLVLLDKTDRLSLHELGNTRPSLVINNTATFWLNANEKILLVWKKNKDLVYLNLKNRTHRTIWKGENLHNVVFNNNRQELAFSNDEYPNLKVWYYDSSMLRAFELNIDHGIGEIVTTSKITAFSKSGNKLFLQSEEKKYDFRQQVDQAFPVAVSVWSYQDVLLPIYQQNGIEERTACLYQWDLRKNSLKQVLRSKESILAESSTGWICISQESAEEESVSYWVTGNKSKTLLQIETGTRIDLGSSIRNFFFSPDGHYGIYSNFRGDTLFRLDLSTGSSSPVLIDIPGSNDFCVDNPTDLNYQGFTIEDWFASLHGFIVSDAYDIWLVPIDLARKPISLTKGYGRRHHIQFRVAIRDDLNAALDKKFLLVSALDYASLKRGFFQMDVLGKKQPSLLVMSNHSYGGQGHILKAKSKETYLFVRESFTESPNYFVTNDFKEYKKVSYLEPHKSILWPQPKLMTWININGHFQRGVLFLPEDFDSTKIYPVIIHFYEQKTLQVYSNFPDSYIGAGVGDELSIPWFVGRGYLIFVVDIRYEGSSPGKNALNSINSGIDELLKLSYVDGKHLGIQGHSFGGFETNYIISHSNRFAAAVSAAGISDLISMQGSIDGRRNMMEFIEHSQIRMQSVVWERPDLYIENSPLFNVDKICTPLLLMHNREDNVPFNQGLELFLGLRRTGKRVWLLEYDNEGHVIGSNHNVTDYLKRIDQFFAHYLKGAPAPIWMTRGIPAKDKGKVTGYEYDTEIKTPGRGLPSDEELKKIDEYSKIPLGEKLKRFTEPERDDLK